MRNWSGLNISKRQSLILTDAPSHRDPLAYRTDGLAIATLAPTAACVCCGVRSSPGRGNQSFSIRNGFSKNLHDKAATPIVASKVAAKMAIG